MARPPRRPPKVLANLELQGQALQLVDQLGRINRENLWEEMEEADAISLEWGILSAKADRRVADADAHVDVVRARLRKAVRTSARALESKTTVDEVNDEVTLHAQYQEALRLRAEAQETADMLTSAKFVTVRRAERLTHLTNFLREEDRANFLGEVAAAQDDPRRVSPEPPRRRAMR